MAIQFARAQYVSRSKGGDACLKSAYNSRSMIVNNNSNKSYNFFHKKDNVHHEILIPQYVNSDFKKAEYFSNEIEKSEVRKNSQLFKEYVLALPDEKNIGLEIKKEMVFEFIKEMDFIENNLGVQIDIHSPHSSKNNWHAHLLVTTRRFSVCGQKFAEKARDLEPKLGSVGNGSYVKNISKCNIGKIWTNIQNKIFEKYGLENRVDEIGPISQFHIGPTRMRNILNKYIKINKKITQENKAIISNKKSLIDYMFSTKSMVNKKYLSRLIDKFCPDDINKKNLKEEVLNNSLERLYTKDGNFTGYYTIKQIRLEENRILRLSDYISKKPNLIKGYKHINDPDLSNDKNIAIQNILNNKKGINVLIGRAGTGKSFLLNKLANIYLNNNIEVIALAPTHKACEELRKKGVSDVFTVKSFLFKNHINDLIKPNTVVILDEAGMVSNEDYTEVLKVVNSTKANIILSGDDRQLVSVQRGGMFAALAEKHNSTTISKIRRQKKNWAKSFVSFLSKGNIKSAINMLQDHGKIFSQDSKAEILTQLVNDWIKDKSKIKDKLIITIKNYDVSFINTAIRTALKDIKLLKGQEIFIDGKPYMVGDRIIIKKTSKNLNLLNGEMGEVEKIEKDKILLKLDNGKRVGLHISESGFFTHGYAITVYKSQGMGIKNVYMYHDGFSSLNASYVSLSRHINDVKLYFNKKSTKNLNDLMQQLGTQISNVSSVNYYTKSDLQNINANKKSTIRNFISKKITFIRDNIITDSYYNREFSEGKNSNRNRINILEKAYYKNNQFNKNKYLDNTKKLNIAEKLFLNVKKSLFKSAIKKDNSKSKDLNIEI